MDSKLTYVELMTDKEIKVSKQVAKIDNILHKFQQDLKAKRAKNTIYKILTATNFILKSMKDFNISLNEKNDIICSFSVLRGFGHGTKCI